MAPRSESPGGNSMLHAQIRSLQRQLDAKSEETASLRRQLDTRDDMDVGLLSEQLRSAKRECAMWKGRAEAAERRVAALERFTHKIRCLKGGDGQYDSADVSPRERESTDTTGTEDGELVTSRIKITFRNLDGARSSDGGAAAWWNTRNGVDEGINGQLAKHQQLGLTDAALLGVVEAVQELMADEDSNAEGYRQI
ncbi:RhoGAP group protein [Colletotrichum kahawae]|uniref:RhoGAP group protein n=1 Tax=Colletotrichum kahawae TaxID=34407 RepID=A0AAD9YEY4_COLKA|nr:RhoGAP group protein [Colletotrichum kahawae]